MNLKYSDFSDRLSWQTQYPFQLNAPINLVELIEMLDANDFSHQANILKQLVDLFGPGVTAWGNYIGTTDGNTDFEWMLFSSYPLCLGFKTQANALLAKLTIE